ncbi:MAG: serine/threonine protein kinase [Myxococcales bacterium]|nr:serine/threonine protein kinase [Myxococcales bacterium]
MAVVYRVRHNQLGSLHAMKVLSLPTPIIRKRLLQEGRVQSTLRHPNVVAVTDVVDVEGIPALVMEYVGGPSLSDFLTTCTPSIEQADALAEGILSGVTAAHALGFVHRDLKPGNILLSTAGGVPVPKITDFGLAKVLEQTGDTATRTRSGSAMGTPAYMAPEQIRDASSVDHRADLWSLGAILFELLHGHRAFRGSDTMELFQAVCDGGHEPIDPTLEERFRAAIEAALQVDREERVPDCGTLRSLWTGSDTDAWSSARGVWDQKTLFQVQSLSQESLPSMEAPSGEGTFVFTSESERAIQEARGVTFEVATVPAGTALLGERPVDVTRPFTATTSPLSNALIEALGFSPPLSWDDAVQVANALSAEHALPAAYELGDWVQRKEYHLDDMGRILYEIVRHDRIAGVLSAFGEQTLHVLQFTPQRLTEVDGIGPKTAAKIGAAWDRTRCFTRPVTVLDNAGWRLPTEAELLLCGPGGKEWTAVGDEGPSWSDVPSEVPESPPPDWGPLTGNRRLVRDASDRWARPPEYRDPSVRVRLIRREQSLSGHSGLGEAARTSV